LIIGSGLSTHALQDLRSFHPNTAAQGYKDFEKEVTASIDDTNSVSNSRVVLIYPNYEYLITIIRKPRNLIKFFFFRSKNETRHS
jgi:aromatic ring-opening dioxygenase catalytic subunit (LigB family)